MRPTPEPTINAVLPSPDSHSLVTNFADLKPTTCATISMSFFYGRTVSVVAHGLTKEAAVPATDIKQAISRKAAFIANPAADTFKGETKNA